MTDEIDNSYDVIADSSLFDDFRNGTVTSKEVRSACSKDPEALIRLAHMYRDGDGVPASQRTCLDLLRDAMYKGSYEAAWEILESPEMPGEDPAYSQCHRRKALDWMLTKYVESTYLNGSLMCGNVDDPSMLPELERRALDHPEIAATMICSGRREWRDDPDFWIDAAGDAFIDKTSRVLVGLCIDNRDVEGCLRRLRKASEHRVAWACTMLGAMEFIGYGVERDPVSARRRFETASAGGDRLASAWLSLYSGIGDRPAGDKRDAFRGGRRGGSIRHSEALQCDLDDLPELAVLRQIASLNPPSAEEGHTILSGPKGICNRTFFIHETDSRDTLMMAGAARLATPRFCFLPTGFELTLDRRGREVVSNRRLGRMDIRRILRICIRSVVDGMAGREAL